MVCKTNFLTNDLRQATKYLLNNHDHLLRIKVRKLNMIYENLLYDRDKSEWEEFNKLILGIINVWIRFHKQILRLRSFGGNQNFAASANPLAYAVYKPISKTLAYLTSKCWLVSWIHTLTKALSFVSKRTTIFSRENFLLCSENN